LKRLTFSATLDEAPQRIQLRLAQGAVEVQIELHPRHLENVRQQQLNLKPRRLHAFSGEEIRAALDHIKNGHAPR